MKKLLAALSIMSTSVFGFDCDPTQLPDYVVQEQTIKLCNVPVGIGPNLRMDLKYMLVQVIPAVELALVDAQPAQHFGFNREDTIRFKLDGGSVILNLDFTLNDETYSSTWFSSANPQWGSTLYLDDIRQVYANYDSVTISN